MSPAVAATEYARPVCCGQTETGPLMVPGVAGSLVNANVLAGEEPQLFTAVTDRVPVVKADGICMEIPVPVLVEMLHPAAGVQL